MIFLLFLLKLSTCFFMKWCDYFHSSGSFLLSYVLVLLAITVGMRSKCPLHSPGGQNIKESRKSVKIILSPKILLILLKNSDTAACSLWGLYVMYPLKLHSRTAVKSFVGGIQLIFCGLHYWFWTVKFFTEFAQKWPTVV